MRTIAFVFALLTSLLFISCEKGNMEIRHMYRGDGIWVIESIRYQYYDSTGTTVTSTYDWNKPGELIFFSSPTLNELYSHHQVVADMFDTSGAVLANPGWVYFDGDRVAFMEDGDADHNFPDELQGLWTIDVDKRNKQEWSIYSTDINGILVAKATMFLTKK